MENVYSTKLDVEQMVIEAITSDAVEDVKAEFDIDTIIDETFEYSPELQGFVQSTDTDGFWASVERNAH